MTLIKRVVLFDLPLSVKGYCFNDSEGDKVCVLNSRYTREDNIDSYNHEISHTSDFGVLDVDALENLRHK